MDVTIDIAIEDDRWAGVGDLDALAHKAIRAAKSQVKTVLPQAAEVSVVLCDDMFIRGLNKTWRGQDKATNVLSFPTEEPALLGDIIVAYETSDREAIEEGKTLADHLTHLLVHGFLHLIGFDHDNDQDAEVMERLEIQALLTIGIGSPYVSKLDAEDARPAP